MLIRHQLLEIATASGLQIYDLTGPIQAEVTAAAIHTGQVIVFSRHTTTAIAINEAEPRLFEDVTNYLRVLAPVGGLTIDAIHQAYKHNDLHLRPNIPPDEPRNAHAHLMAMTLSTSEVIPIMDGKLALGTYQAVLLFELDGPRDRTVLLQLSGLSRDG